MPTSLSTPICNLYTWVYVYNILNINFNCSEMSRYWWWRVFWSPSSLTREFLHKIHRGSSRENLNLNTQLMAHHTSGCESDGHLTLNFLSGPRLDQSEARNGLHWPMRGRYTRLSEKGAFYTKIFNSFKFREPQNIQFIILLWPNQWTWMNKLTNKRTGNRAPEGQR